MRSAAILAMLLVVGSAVVAVGAQREPSDAYMKGLGLVASGKIEAGLAALRSLAESGDRDAELMLAHANSQPNAIIKQPDYAEAIRWYRRASEQGIGEASAGLAEMYEGGAGVPRSPEEAKKWWDLAASQGWDQQELRVACFRRHPGVQSLTCTPERELTCPTPAEMQMLQQAGISGVLDPSGTGVRFRAGPKARAIIVIDHPIAGEVRLDQPRHTGVIYVQQDDGWKMLPSDAPLLKRPLTLKPQSDMPQDIMIGVQDVDGSSTYGGCAIFK